MALIGGHRSRTGQQSLSVHCGAHTLTPYLFQSDNARYANVNANTHINKETLPAWWNIFMHTQIYTGIMTEHLWEY